MSGLICSMTARQWPGTSMTEDIHKLSIIMIIYSFSFKFKRLTWNRPKYNELRKISNSVNVCGNLEGQLFFIGIGIFSRNRELLFYLLFEEALFLRQHLLGLIQLLDGLTGRRFRLILGAKKFPQKLISGFDLNRNMWLTYSLKAFTWKFEIF